MHAGDHTPGVAIGDAGGVVNDVRPAAVLPDHHHHVAGDVDQVANLQLAQHGEPLLVIVIGLIIATVVIALMLNALIFKRLDRIMSSMEEISLRGAGGDFDAHFQPDGTNDEIGKFEQFFARFLDLMSGTLKSLVGRS